jgi:subtilisin-like proprotein convertase family protein
MGICHAGASSAAIVKSFDYAGPPVAIPDPPGIVDPVSVDLVIPVQADGHAEILDVNLSILIAHTYQGDLQFTLRHVETGTLVSLVNRTGGPVNTSTAFSANNFGNPSTLARFVLDDEAAAIYDLPAVAAPGIANVSGAWRPEGALSTLDGESIVGTWRLTLTDWNTLDSGTLQDFGLEFTVVPEPATFGLACAALLAVPRLRRRDGRSQRSEAPCATT